METGGVGPVPIMEYRKHNMKICPTFEMLWHKQEILKKLASKL